MSDHISPGTTHSSGTEVYSLAPQMCQTSRDRKNKYESATMRYQNIRTTITALPKAEAKSSSETSKKRRRGRSYYRTKNKSGMIFENALEKLKNGLKGTEYALVYTPNPLTKPQSLASRTGKSLFQWDKMPKPADVVGGELPPDRAPRKRDQLFNLMTFVVPFMFDGCTVVDFASGSGHQSIPLAAKFPRCNFVLIDMKKKSIDIANRRVRELKLKNVT